MNLKIRIKVFDLIKSIGMVVIVAIVLSLVVQPTIVDGPSMYPTLKDRDYLIVNKLAYFNSKPSRGDILTFRSNLLDSNSSQNKILVKRVIALPGEHIIIRNSQVYINNKLLKEEYIQNVDTNGIIDVIVPENNVFVMGDNRVDSLDSRDNSLGMIHLENLIGKVFIRVFPFNKISFYF